MLWQHWLQQSADNICEEQAEWNTLLDGEMKAANVAEICRKFTISSKKLSAPGYDIYLEFYYLHCSVT